MNRQLPLAVLACILLACQSAQQETASSSDTANGQRDRTLAGADTGNARADGAGSAAGSEARVMMRTADGREAGALTITESVGGLLIAGRLASLPPGVHAMHVHTMGQCDAPAFTSASGHWNPTGRQHGSANPAGPHRGDLPNVTVGVDSTVSVSHTIANGSLRGTDGLLDGDGAALVLHAKADDYRTDPAGNAGDRIVCGVVQPVN